MSFQGENSTAAASSGERSCSSEDEGDIQCEILEKQRDEASQKLSEMEEVSSQLLKEMDVLEMQFQIERSCRESAEALAVKVTKENKVLKRRSQGLLPLLPKLPEYMATVTFDLESDQGVDPNPDGDSGEEAVLQGQAQIRELQASVEQLLGEKMQLCEQVDSLKREQSQLEEQLALEIGEKEAILKKLSKQNKNMNKMKRVSHSIPASDRGVHRDPSETGPGTGSQTVEPTECALEESSVLSELQCVRGQLESSEEERRTMDTQLREAQNTVTQLQGEVKQLEDRLKDAEKDLVSEKDNSTPALPPPLPPPPPPPPLPPPSSSTAVDPLVVLRNKRKESANNIDKNKPDPTLDMKTRAVDAMMERIKKGIVLRPSQRPQVGSEDDCAWRDQRIEKRKSAVLELKGMLDTIRPQEGMAPRPQEGMVTE
uniref:shootin-1-like n=1 Tax=Oncorhynchus gorbuscha TaxID=8017 RepID=UPI001EAF0EBB|nr:shootin-1-like [Oncorhynchus gorbuscha]